MIKKSLLLPLPFLLLWGCSNGQQASSVTSISSSSDTAITSSSFSSETESTITSSSSASSLPKYDLNPRDEPMAGNQKHLDHIGDIDEVWKKYRGDGVAIAVIDSGFYVDHPEFVNADGSSKVLSTSAYFHFEGSRVVKEIGKDKVGITDGDSHGTFCATVAAGSVAGKGTTGIAPNASLLLLKTDKTPKAICEAFRYAADLGVKVATISIGSYNGYVGDLVDDGSDLTTVFEDSLKYAHDKGMVICSAGGNGGEDSQSRATEYTYPGASSYVIGVGGLAYNSDSTIWSGSSYNYSKIYQFCDVFAPANNMYSGCYYMDGAKEVIYDGGWNGTSFASPQVAGVAALFFQKNPKASNRDFEVALFNSSVPFGDEQKTGYGRLDVKALLDFEEEPSMATYYFEDASWWSQDGAKPAFFAWNYGNTLCNHEYPGQMMTSLGNGRWSMTLNSLEIDILVISRVSPNGEYWGAKTVDIEVDKFGINNCYSISSTTAAWESQGKLAEGQFKSINA